MSRPFSDRWEIENHALEMRPALKDRRNQRPIPATNVKDFSETGEIVGFQRVLDSISDCLRHGAVEQLVDLGAQL